MEFKSRKSDSYICTLDVDNKKDMATLQRIRENIKFENTCFTQQRRVVVRGRKPKVRMGNVYDWGGNLIGGIKNAQIVDVYIYDRF